MADFGSVTFTGLHLFPRTLFAIGAALFIFSLVPPTKFPVALLGLGVIFFAVGFNILYDLIRSWKRVFEKKDEESSVLAAWAKCIVRAFSEIRRRCHELDYSLTSLLQKTTINVINYGSDASGNCLITSTPITGNFYFDPNSFTNVGLANRRQLRQCESVLPPLRSGKLG
jgi:hypothetical protein